MLYFCPKSGQKHSLKPLRFLPMGTPPSSNHTLCNSISCVLDKDRNPSDLPMATQEGGWQPQQTSGARASPPPPRRPSSDPCRCWQTHRCSSPNSTAWRLAHCYIKMGFSGCVHGCLAQAGCSQTACPSARSSEQNGHRAGHGHSLISACPQSPAARSQALR